jgi:hypothetical protein
MKSLNDKVRKWMWLALPVALAWQFYFVRELVAAFALFVVGCGVIGLVIASLYGLAKGWEIVATRLVSGGRAILHIAPIGVVKGGAHRAA